MTQVPGVLVFGLLVAQAVGCGRANPISPSSLPTNAVRPAPPPGRVAIISIDGLRPDAIPQAGAPNIQALAARGAYSWQARTILPSTTLPSHVSMLSGFGPDVHGMVWDDYMPERGPLTVPTIFTAARSQGLRTAMLAGKPKFTYFCDTGACDVWAIDTGGDDQVTSHVVSGNVDLLFVHLPDVDLTGHANQWMSQPYFAAVRRADQAVGRILSLLPSDTTVILSADHGGHLGGHGSSAAVDVTIPWIVAGPAVVRGKRLSSSIRTVDTAATAAYVLGIPFPTNAGGQPVYEAFAVE